MIGNPEPSIDPVPGNECSLVVNKCSLVVNKCSDRNLVTDWAILLRGGGAPFLEDVPLVKFVYLVSTRVPGESYRR